MQQVHTRLTINGLSAR